jgi:hypothetical protein
MPLPSYMRVAIAQRVFRVDYRARIPSPYCGAFREEVQRIDGQGAARADDHLGAIGTETARDCLHGFGVSYGGDDGLMQLDLGRKV